MGEMFSGALGRGRDLLAGFTIGQKVITVLAVIGLIAGGLAFSTWASTPTYAPLYHNLSGADASAIVDKLTSNGTPYQLADGGATVLVPKEQVYDARLKMSGQGLPASDASGYALLDKEGLTSSQFRQHVAYQRALEGELGKTIQSIDGVRAAVVHLAIPQKDVFDDQKKTTTASVLVDTVPGRQLTPQQVQAVVNLVASSVEDLPADQVTVAASSGKVLSVAGGGAGLDAASDARTQQKLNTEDQLARSAQQMLEQVVGPGHAVIRVNADLDFDQRNTTSEKYAKPQGNPAVADTITNETYTGAASPSGGVLGSPAGVPAAAGSNTNYIKRGQTRNSAVDRTVEETKNAPGAVKRLTVAVLLDNRSAGTIDPAKVSALVSRAVGLDPTRGDAIEVSAMAFDQSAATAAKKDIADATAADKRASTLSMVKTGGFVLIGLMILFLTWRSSRRRRTGAAPAEIDLEDLAELRQKVALAVAEEERAALESRKAVLAEIETRPSGPDDNQDTERLQISSMRKEIAEMVEKQPDEVAQLLRSWLADRRS